MITVEVFATGRALTPDQERDLADHVLQALTTGESRSGCTRVALSVQASRGLAAGESRPERGRVAGRGR